MRAKSLFLGGIVGAFVVLSAVVVVVGQGSMNKPSEVESYQETLNDLAVTGNRSMPRPTPVSDLQLTHASTTQNTLIHDYTFSAGATVDRAGITSAVATLATHNCGVTVYQESIFNRGLTLRMNLLDSGGSLLLSRDLKKAGCPASGTR